MWQTRMMMFACCVGLPLALAGVRAQAADVERASAPEAEADAKTETAAPSSAAWLDGMLIAQRQPPGRGVGGPPRHGPSRGIGPSQTWRDTPMRERREREEIRRPRPRPDIAQGGDAQHEMRRTAHQRMLIARQIMEQEAKYREQMAKLRRLHALALAHGSAERARAIQELMALTQAMHERRLELAKGRLGGHFGPIQTRLERGREAPQQAGSRPGAEPRS